MPGEIMGVVMRQLPGHAAVPSALLAIPERELNQDDPDRVPDWKKYLLREQAQQHKADFIERMPEFDSAKWMLYFMYPGGILNAMTSWEELE